MVRPKLSNSPIPVVTCGLALTLVAVHSLSPGGWALQAQDPEALQAVSHLFVHNSWSHLGANLLTLCLAGAWYERRQGAVSALLLFLVAGVLGGLAEVLFDSTYSGTIVGASGGLSAYLGTLAEERLAALLLVLPVLTYYVWEALTPGGPNADWAHLTGLVLGLIWTAARPSE